MDKMMEKPDWTLEDTLRSYKNIIGLGREAIVAIMRAIDPAEISFGEDDEEY